MKNLGKTKPISFPRRWTVSMDLKIGIIAVTG
jgi:hypothetical protein